MFKIFTITALAFLQLFAGVYYAKIEPLNSVSLKASVSGEVQEVAKELEGKFSQGGVVVKIDDILDNTELQTSKEKLISLQKILEATKQNIKNAKEIEGLKEQSYERIKNLKTKSRLEKENELIALINAQNQSISLQNTLENFKIQVSDLHFKIASLQDRISKKNIQVQKDFYLYALHVERGDFVNIGTPLIDVFDLSKGKLTLFLLKEDVELAKSGVVYIDGEPTNYKVHKIWNVADSQNISAYKAEILIDAPKQFSQLLKVEFKP
ncbi:MAG: HlyD family secretion protein [Sulfurospirillum sp.]|nr:HlyD family secretion protein [Sulfurospirillum sp.]